MKDVQIVIRRPRERELKALGWNTWRGMVQCRHCGVEFQETMCGTRAQAEAWDPFCSDCWEVLETEDEIFWSVDDQQRWGDE